MAKLYNLARVNTATTGTGPLTLGSAVSGWLIFAAAGVQDGDVISYAIRDGGNSEIGHGTYSSAGPTLTRDTILKSTNSGLAISLSGAAQVFITPAAEDLSVNLGSWKYWKIRNITPGDPLSNTTISSLQMRATVGGAAQTVSTWTASTGTAADAATGTGWTPLIKQTITGSFGAHTLGDSAPWLKMFFSTAVSVAEIALTSATADRNALRTFDVWVSNDDLTYFLVTSFDCSAAGGAQTFELPSITLGLLSSSGVSGSTTLSGLSDVNVIESSAIDGQVLVYQDSSGKFIANSVVGEALWTPPTTSTFPTTKLGTGGSISNMSGGRGVRLTATKATTNVNSTTYALIAVPTGGAHSGWIATARLRRHWGLTTWGMTGMIIRDSGSGKSKRLSMGNDNLVGFNFNTYSADDTWASVGRGAVYNAMNWWQRIWHDGTNINWQISQDGENWETITTESPTAYLTSAPTHVGIAMVPNFGGDPQGANPFSMDCLSWSGAAY